MTKFEAYRHVDENYKLPATMKAALLSGIGYENLRVTEVPVPLPGPNQVLARVDATTLCVSMDKAIKQGSTHPYFYGWDSAKHPVILGDEGSITIVKAGKNLKEYVGKRFSIQPAIRCAPINNRERYANNGVGIERLAVGYTLGGHYAQYILILEEVIQNNALVPLPDENMPYFAVSLSEPMSTVVRAQQLHIRAYQLNPLSPRELKVGLKKGGTTVIIGQGAMGRLHDEFALRYAIKNLVMVEPTDRLSWGKRNLEQRANEKGITTFYLNPKEVDVESKIKEITDGKMADDIIIAVGVQEVQQNALRLAGRGGIVNFFGGLKGITLQFKPEDLHYNEVIYTGSSGAEPYDMQLALEAIVKGDISPSSHTALIGSFDDITDLLERAVNAKFDGKVVVYPNLHLEETIETNGKWDGEKEKNVFEKSL